MAQFTFLEVHLDGAQVSATTPFGGSDESDAEETAETKLTERLLFGGSSENETEEDDETTLEERLPRSDDGPAADRPAVRRSPVGLLLGFVLLAGAVAVARDLRSRRSGPDEEPELETEEPIVAD